MILDRVLGPAMLSTPGPTDPFWYGPVNRTHGGMVVDEESAMTVSAFYRGVKLIAGTESTLPLPVYKQEANGDKFRQREHVVDRLLNERPNPEMDSQNFRELLDTRMIIHGNGYAEIERTVGGMPHYLWPLPKKAVQPKRVNGKVWFFVRYPGEMEPVPIPQENMLNLANNVGADGVTGCGVIQYAARSIGGALAADENASSFYANGSAPGGVLEHPGVLTKQAAERLVADWEKRHGGPSRVNRVALLEEGMKWSSTGVPPEQAQLLETRKWSVAEMARWLGVAPHLLYDLESGASYASVEVMGREFLSFSLRYWLTKWTIAGSLMLFTEAERKTHFIEHITAAIVQADIAARYQAYKTAREGGWASVNDILRTENQNPIGPKGDVYLVPLNHVNAESMVGKEDDEPMDDTETETGTVVPVESSDEAAATGDIQATALNGAQIAEMHAILIDLVAKALPPETVRNMLYAGFPLVDRSLIDRMVDEAESFEAPEPEPALPPFGQQPQEEPPAVEEPPPEEPADDGLSVMRDSLASMASTIDAAVAGLREDVGLLAADLESSMTCTASRFDALDGRLSAMQFDVREVGLGHKRLVGLQVQMAAATVRDIMLQMVSTEVNHIKRVAEKPSRFDERLREFYEKHTISLTRSLREPIAVLLATRDSDRSVDDVVSEIVVAHVSESLRQLGSLLDCKVDELPTKIDECVSKWHEERTAVKV